MMCSRVIMFAALAQFSISAGEFWLNESKNKNNLKNKDGTQAISFETHLHGNEFIFIDRIACYVEKRKKKNEKRPCRSLLLLLLLFSLLIAQQKIIIKIRNYRPSTPDVFGTTIRPVCLRYILTHKIYHTRPSSIVNLFPLLNDDSSVVLLDGHFTSTSSISQLSLRRHIA